MVGGFSDQQLSSGEIPMGILRGLSAWNQVAWVLVVGNGVMASEFHAPPVKHIGRNGDGQIFYPQDFFQVGKSFPHGGQTTTEI